MNKKQSFLLLFAVLVIATCGLIYELVACTLSSYLLGDSITQFSTIIGAYLFAMGIGSWLTKYINGNILSWFIQIELLVGVIGGCSALILFFSFGLTGIFQLILYINVLLIGILVGLEIPLLMRLLKENYQFSDLVSKVLSVDYMGALLASIAFPLFFMPKLGLVRTSLFFGIINVVIGIWMSFSKFDEKVQPLYIRVLSIFSFLFLTLMFIYGDKLTQLAESAQLGEHIIYARSSPYQRILLTRSQRDLKLYLNGNLQFSSADEYRYHESLIHPVFEYAKRHKSVLILGGGDGMAAREILKYPDVENITLVDLDPQMTKMFKENSLLTSLNKNSLNSRKIKVVNQDAFAWLKLNHTQYDLIIIDFPDPGNFSIGKLYTTAFYRLLQTCMHTETVGVVQSTSPLFAPKSFHCVENTLKSSGVVTLPYHVYIPSFGEWGYIMFSNEELTKKTINLPSNLKYYTSSLFSQMCQFPLDMVANNTTINSLNNQLLVDLFEKEWSNYIQ
ncbi:MAG TPA: polyamine aminopropyltransferase [Chitinophagaceae bacterium]|nr:polyamine aminopropyltransferase [Chitinophagaceae bacterium]